MKSEMAGKRRHVGQRIFLGGGWSKKAVEAGRHAMPTFSARAEDRLSQISDSDLRDALESDGETSS
jgi:hypothetical protein